MTTPPRRRFLIEEAAIAADLPPSSLLLLLVMLTLTDSVTGRIPDYRMPSITELVRKTGLARSTVCVHLNYLEEHGWLVRQRPSRARAQREHARTQYAICLPDAEVIHSPDEAGPAGGDELVRPDSQAGPADGHRGPSPSRPSRAHARAWREDCLTAIEDTLREVAPGRVDAHSRAWAEQVLANIPIGAQVRARARYVATVVANDPDRYLPTAGPPPLREALAAAVPREEPV